MTERNEIGPDEETGEIKIRGTDPEQIKITGLEIDNGKFKVKVDRSAFDAVCDRKEIHSGMRDQLWQQIESFNTGVIAAEEGEAIGSTDPIAAIQSELWSLAQERADVPDFSLDEVREFVADLNK